MPTVVRDGVKLHFSESGDGPVVLWHTGGGGDGRMWQRAGYLDALPGWRHVLLDHRGHGSSGEPEQVQDHRIGEYTADVAAVLDALCVDRAVVIGYSAGARVGFRFAASHPSRISALVAIGGTPIPLDLSAWDREMADQVRRTGMRATMEQMSASEDEAAPDWLIDNLAETPTEMFALMLEAWSKDTGPWEDLPLITVPTLLICGERETTEADAQRAASRLRHGRVVRLPGFGHLQSFWHAEVTGVEIRNFLTVLPS